MAVKERRKCNPGPVPPVDMPTWVNKIIDYIDAIGNDNKLFELGTYYAEANSNRPVDLDEMAQIADFVVAVLKAAPNGRVSKSVLKECLLQAIEKRPNRQCCPHKVPLTAWVTKVARPVLCVCFMFCRICREVAVCPELKSCPRIHMRVTATTVYGPSDKI